MSTYPTKIVYVGDKLPDMINKIVTVSDMADRLNKPVSALRACLSKRGVIKRGTITDEDIAYYLPDAPAINKRTAAAALMARSWR
jgi:hypothetical protein